MPRVGLPEAIHKRTADRRRGISIAALRDNVWKHFWNEKQTEKRARANGMADESRAAPRFCTRLRQLASGALVAHLDEGKEGEEGEEEEEEEEEERHQRRRCARKVAEELDRSPDRDL
jgi:hypothetical protein